VYWKPFHRYGSELATTLKSRFIVVAPLAPAM